MITVTDVTDVVDTVFHYSYDFDGSGTFVPGGPVAAVPAAVTARSGVNVITVRVFDGTDYAEYQTELTVRPVGPTVAIRNNQRVLVVEEGSAAELPGTVVNPGNDALVWTASVGAVTADGRGGWTWRYTPDDGPADGQTVVVTATDADGLSDSVEFTLRVVNVAPAGTLDAVVVDEGSPATVGFSGVTDPSAADTASGFQVAYDFGDGAFVPGGDSVSVLAAFLADDGRFEVIGRLSDKDGDGYQRTTVTVRNVAPVLTALDVTPTTAEGGEVTLTGAFTDPGLRDVHTVQVVWGDDAVEVVTLTPGERTFALKHVYRDNSFVSGQTPGTYSVEVRLSDDDGGVTTGAATVDVTNVAPRIRVVVVGPVVVGQPFTLRGAYQDAGADDGQTVRVDWGDGTTSTAQVGGRHVVDFDRDVRGNSLAAGQAVTTQFATDDGRGFTVASLASGSPAVIADSGLAGPLGAPNQAAGGPGIGAGGAPGERGQNLTPQGAVLTASAGAGLVFRFPTPAVVESVDVLNAGRVGGQVRTYDAAGRLLTVTTIPLAGVNSFQRVMLRQAYRQVNGQLVAVAAARVEVSLPGGGAVARLAYRYPDNAQTFALRHVARRVGPVDIRVTLTDDDGGQDTTAIRAIVRPPAPQRWAGRRYGGS